MKEYEYVRKTFTFEGKRYEVYAKTEAEAIQKKADKLAELKRGETTISGSMTVKAWCEQYLSTYVEPRVKEAGAKGDRRNSLTRKSADMYRQKIDGYVVPAIGHMKLKQVTGTHLQKIVNGQAGMSFSHVNKLINVIQQLFQRATQERLIVFDPSVGLDMPNTIKNTRRSLTAQELAVFYKVAATHKHGVWAEFHLRFGVRQGEVPPLQVKDLDFEKHLLNIDKAIESGSGAVKDPKTKAGNRSIPIPLDFEPKLKGHVAGKSPFDYLFPGDEGNMMTQSGITRRWKSFKRAMDIEMGAEVNEKNKVVHSVIADDLTIHCLRHTFCTDLGAKGIDASIGRFVTGHSDVATLANIYTHKNDDVINFIANKINGVGNDGDVGKGVGNTD